MHAPRPVPTQTILDPYIGLRPYTDSDDDCARFFGREQEQEIIIANLYATSLTVFYGASGVGKSSVLLAGVVPKLRQTPRFACVVFRTWQLEKVLPQLRRRSFAQCRSPRSKQSGWTQRWPLMISCSNVRGFFVAASY